ncbi:amidohydrolase [Arcticibacter eurypsychrophilus]|uniref:amidohydrolase n=1 Tax=Arcticibacter eurypsychrophilus TaxID=1434752 RepID=UPI00084D22BA|nr:amidohydrolase [Arcticibacter eurypsychrophilus]
MRLFYFAFIVLLATSCSTKREVDMLVYHAKVYTVDDRFSLTEAFAVRDGKIIETGTSDYIKNSYKAAKELDAGGKPIYPGFIDGHAHFFGYGSSLQQVNLMGTKSWQEAVDRLAAFAENNKEGWLIGYGWDQNDWENKSFPDNLQLNKLFPDRPVSLSRIDGHATIVNDAAIKKAGLMPGFKLEGGEVETKDGRLTGILIDNATKLVAKVIPARTIKQRTKELLDAQKNCFAKGLTTVADCGVDYAAIAFVDSLQRANQLKMRMYMMLSDKPANYDYLFKNGAFKTDRLDVRSFKVYADGALGSRGACLLKPYADQPGHYGFLLSKKAHFAEVAEKIFAKGFQMCTHAIGDSANREILKVYGKVLKGSNDRRWRIEHAQVISPEDLKLFKQFSIIPSVQSTHATSDMYWAAERLGAERLKGAYANKQLMQQNGWIILGTDFPVEKIDPLLTFYAAVFRRDDKAYPANGFQIENGLTKEETLRGITIWAAKGNFEEKEKGSLEKGKFADFVILDQDIMTAKPEEILKNKVLKTYLNGENVFEFKSGN